jgi:hypothetical protein
MSDHVTGLNKWLTYHRIDTLIIAGCVTSGCVRATVRSKPPSSYLSCRPVALWLPFKDSRRERLNYSMPPCHSSSYNERGPRRRT